VEKGNRYAIEGRKKSADLAEISAIMNDLAAVPAGTKRSHREFLQEVSRTGHGVCRKKRRKGP
jgi:hypothetical protein